jgi:hypothetical protein
MGRGETNMFFDNVPDSGKGMKGMCAYVASRSAFSRDNTFLFIHPLYSQIFDV